MYYKDIITNGSCFDVPKIEYATDLAFKSPEFLSDVTLEVSNEERESRYQMPSAAEVKRELRKIAKRYIKNKKELEGVLEKIKSAQSIGQAKEGLFWEITEALKIVRNTPECDDLHKEIFSDLPDDKDVSRDKSYVNGVYLDDERKIILYLRQIEGGKYSTEEKIKSYQETLAHELFHAYHYSLVHNMDKAEFDSNEYYASVVKESLASYFEKNFCTKNGIDFDTYFWYKCILYSPYSGARYIKDLAHFDKIVELSLESMEEALYCLLESDPDLAEKIMKIKGKSKSTVKAPLPPRSPKDPIAVAPPEPPSSAGVTISPVIYPHAPGGYIRPSKSPLLSDKELLEKYREYLYDKKIKEGKSSAKAYNYASSGKTYVKTLTKEYLDGYAKVMSIEDSLLCLIQSVEKTEQAIILVRCLDYLNELKEDGEFYGTSKGRYVNEFKPFVEWFLFIYNP